jgi:glyoxylase-like metal-dependent hydrolase (beta-lactamase superfamily II)
MIVEQVEAGNFAVFAYIVGCPDTGEGVIVDPAAEVDRLVTIANKRGIARIKYIINTHAHADHAGGNRKLKGLTGAGIVIHKEDAERLTHPSPLVLQLFQCEASPPPDRTVTDGELIEFGRRQLKVLHTPGHTPGGICLLADGQVFTGDTLFVGGIGRTDLPGGSFDLLIHSIQTKLVTLPDETVVLPGHNYGVRPSSTIGQEKRSNPFIKR